jgi:Tol biopolymer transport system component
MRNLFFASLLLAGVLGAGSARAGEAPPPVRNGWPCVAPDGTRIAFVSNRDGRDNVFVIDVDGRGERRVSHEGGHLPRWTRDGSEILFAGEDADTERVFALPPNARTARLITAVAGRSPVLSPDGTRVLFVRGAWEAAELVIASPDGGEMLRIAGGKVNGHVCSARNGDWSPDGKRIAYTFGDSTGVLQVHVMNADGTADRAVTSLSAQYGSAQMPDWSPDGTRLAMQVNSGKDKPAHIWIALVATGEAWALNVHTESYRDEVPSWFPDGRRLAFQSDRTGSTQVWVMDEDGSNPRQVTGK